MYRTASADHDPGARGAMLADINQLDWVELAPGVKFKLLRYCDVTGDWVLYVQLQPGVKFGRHKHITPAEFFITKGELRVERGSARIAASAAGNGAGGAGGTAGGGGIAEVVLFMRSSDFCASVFAGSLEGFSRSAYVRRAAGDGPR